MLTALVEEAVSVGDLVRLMRFMQGQASLVELTLAEDSPLAGQRIGDVPLPPDSALVAMREGRVVLPVPEGTLEGGDELLAVASTAEVEAELARLLAGEPGELSPVLDIAATATVASPDDPPAGATARA